MKSFESLPIFAEKRASFCESLGKLQGNARILGCFVRDEGGPEDGFDGRYSRSFPSSVGMVKQVSRCAK